jgi:putative hydrolase of the HAD superfamily
VLFSPPRPLSIRGEERQGDARTGRGGVLVHSALRGSLCHHKGPWVRGAKNAKAAARREKGLYLHDARRADDQAQQKSGATHIKAVSFDGDMTLWDFEKVMRHSLALALAELRQRVPGQATADLTVDKMIEIRNAVAAELKGIVVNLEEIRFQAFRRTVRFVNAADDALAAELNALYLQHRFEDIELYPDVISCLDAIRQRFPIGLVSNGNGYPERCGLPDRFRFVVFSQDVGVEKPDAGIFLAACKQGGCAPCELVHVGDSLASDVAGANGVGAVSVWLNRRTRPNSSEIVPDHEIRSLVDLGDILERYGEPPGISC